VCGVPLGLALVGSILSEIAVSPAELREMMSYAPHRAPTWSPKDDAAVRDNPGLVQLLDACFTLLRWETPAGLGKVAERLLEASSFFAPPVPIPTAMLKAQLIAHTYKLPARALPERSCRTEAHGMGVQAVTILHLAAGAT